MLTYKVIKKNLHLGYRKRSGPTASTEGRGWADHLSKNIGLLDYS
jgi:hypothetical protein